jgi:hypothetical protein
MLFGAAMSRPASAFAAKDAQVVGIPAAAPRHSRPPEDKGGVTQLGRRSLSLRSNHSSSSSSQVSHLGPALFVRARN